MAEHWLKALGSKLLDTGAAYLQQVKLVQELKSMPPDQARAHFLKQVRGMSASARAGFSITLSGLANNERQADAKRFLDMLRSALQNPAAPQAEPALEQPPPVAASEPSDAVLSRLDRWFALETPDRKSAMQTHAAGLADAALAEFAVHVENIGNNITTHIAQHHKDEARIAAGRYIEDQTSYRISRLAGAPPDPGWLATLHNFERSRELVESVLRVTAAEQAERRKPAAPVTPTPAAAPAPAPSGSASTIESMSQMLEQQLASGQLPAERAEAYRRMLAKAAQVIAASDRDDITAAQALAQQQELMADFMPFVADPGKMSAQATPRGREVLRHAGALKIKVLNQIKNLPAAATAQAASAVLGDLTTVQQQAAAARTDGEHAQIEAALLRPAARAWHELQLTQHAVLARPLWDCKEQARAVNTLFYSGAADLQAQLEVVAAGKQLSVEKTRRLQNLGQLRWDLLVQCHVAVFDLRRAGEINELAARAPKRARELTAAAYELGLAFALGKPVLLLANPEDELPFDIDLSPLRLDGDANDEAALAQALDEAFYVAQRESRANSIPAAVAELDRLTRHHPRRAAIAGMGWLDPGLKNDPAGFAAAVRQVLREIDDAAWQLLRPAWPGAYPNEASPFCFHVMPFRPDWADGVRDTAHAACEEAGLAYQRGDKAKEGRIVHAIWDDLCRASVVLVELGGTNLNVMIELGMAHALGKPVLAVQRTGGHDTRPPHIEKLRLYRHASNTELAAVLRDRLKPSSPPSR